MQSVSEKPSLALNPASALFRRHFGHLPALLVRAPGALTLLGSFASIAEGLSLSVTVDRHVSLAASPRQDGRIELVSPLAQTRHGFWSSNLEPSAEAAWANPIKAMLAALRRRGVRFSGFTAAMHDGIPAGLGSSGALAAATGMLVRELHPFTLTEMGIAPPPRRNPRTQQLLATSDLELRQLARLCREARQPDASETSHADAVTPLLGRAWQALVIDWQNGGVERWPFAGTAVVYCDAGEGPARVANSADSTLTVFKDLLASTAAKLGVRSLRSVEPAMLKTHPVPLETQEIAVVSHLAWENQWIVHSETALRDGDHRPLGRFLQLSHESARDGLLLVSPEAEALVSIACGSPGCLGARALFEEGRTTTISLVNYHEIEAFIACLSAKGSERLGRAIHPLVCPIVEGVG